MGCDNRFEGLLGNNLCPFETFFTSERPFRVGNVSLSLRPIELFSRRVSDILCPRYGMWG